MSFVENEDFLKDSVGNAASKPITALAGQWWEQPVGVFWPVCHLLLNIHAVIKLISKEITESLRLEKTSSV